MKGKDRRKQIMKAAIRAFSKYGYEKTSIALICNPLGIARGTLYQYFGNKNSLFRELVRVYTKRISSFLRPFDFERSDRSNFDKFRYKRMLELFEEVYNNREIYSVIMREGLSKNVQMEKTVLKLHWDFIETIGREYEGAVKNGCLKTPDPEFAAVCMYGVILMVIQKYILYTDKPVPPKVLAGRVSALLGNSRMI